MLSRIAVVAVGLMTVTACGRTPNDGGHVDTAAQLREADTAMNAVAAKIEGRLSGDDKQRFVEAEQAWLAYRDANCDAEKARHDGESDQPHVEAACLARLTDERRAELQRVYGSD